ncbi:MAG: 2,3-bisphosphoglycerate-independent phosphoglycerate mutase [Myxococcota bacterium]|nr:2,3-bisphosphoglycerate-independent phosphoglycerate mutase [Myxococcota bacterium]
MENRALLLILDGFGLREAAEDNAIHLAGMPRYHDWRNQGVCSRIFTSGAHVGLPDGQMGNSEVGHVNIGAGRVVKQTLVRISDAVAQNQLPHHPHVQRLAQRLEPGNCLHLVGLVSDGGVHSAMAHLKEAVRTAQRLGVERIAFHALTDGRDTPPDSAKRYLDELSEVLVDGAFLATVGGRYFAMDRDRRWDRVARAWEVIVEGRGPRAESIDAARERAYATGQTHEFIEPVVLEAAPILDGDAVWFLNFRADRMRQFAGALTRPDEEGCFARRLPALSACVSMIRYRQDLEVDVLFDAEVPSQTIGELVSERGLEQLRIAETEKYGHVTYFFNGGSEQVFDGERRVLIDSPRDVATYDLKPQMSAPEVTDRLIEALDAQRYHLLVCNFANPDMVGHTGNLEAAVEAMRALDQCLDRVLRAAQRGGYGVMITADHGNIEQMLTDEGKPHTQHTTGPVPLVLIGMGAAAVRDGALCDLAPTLLDYMAIPQPDEMTGQSLLERV